MSESVNTVPATKSKSVKITVISVIVTILLLAAALFFSAFEFSPVRQVPAVADKTEIAAWTKFMSNVFMSYGMQREMKAPAYTFVFSESELNAALNMAMRNYSVTKQDSKKYLIYTQAKSGTMEYEASIPKWGMYLNFRLIAVPDVKDGNITVKVKSARLGKLPLPASVVESAIAKKLAEKLSDPMAQAGAKMIKNVEFTPENKLKVVFDTLAAKALKGLFR